jgi:hypothetical protein
MFSKNLGTTSNFHATEGCDEGSSILKFLFLSYKANARVKPAKTGHGPDSS